MHIKVSRILEDIRKESPNIPNGSDASTVSFDAYDFKRTIDSSIFASFWQLKIIFIYQEHSDTRFQLVLASVVSRAFNVLITKMLFRCQIKCVSLQFDG